MAIEKVNASHRTSPAEKVRPEPQALVIAEDSIRAKVERQLRRAVALEERVGSPLTTAQLQAEMDRMARDTKAPAVLEELFTALGNDPLLIAECLARPIVVDRLSRQREARDSRPLEDSDVQIVRMSKVLGNRGDGQAALSYHVPAILGDACVNDTWSPTSQGGPDTRDRYTTVWTGAELIIWGGSVSNVNTSFPIPLDTGGRYNPATDTWTPTIRVGAPQPREWHAAVWTGREMVVWGGSVTAGDGQKTYFNSGGRYDPIHDAWLPTSVAGDVPAARERATAVWTGSAMIVWGGLNSAPLKTGGLYDPSTDSWRPTSTGVNVPAERQGHSAVWTGQQMIVWGGRNTTGFLNSGGRYDPETDAWTATSTGANVPAARRGHAATWIGTAMFVWGGTNGPNLNTGGRYDPVSDSWTPTSTGANVPPTMSIPNALWTGTRVIVWGAVYPSGAGSLYDPASDQWTLMSSSANLEGGASATWTGSEMLVWAGFRPDHRIGVARYHPLTNDWIVPSTGIFPEAAEGQLAFWTGSEMLVWSNFSVTGGNARYDPATDAWTRLSPVGEPEPRSSCAGVWTGREMIIWGGSGAGPMGGVYMNTGGRYDPATDTWRPTSVGANVPAPRIGHSAVWTGRETVVGGGAVPPPHFSTV